MVPVFLCRCACGFEESIPKTKLLRRNECRFCLRGPCIICGGVIPDDKPNSNTCSEVCSKAKIAMIDSKAYTKRLNFDPEFNKKQYQKKRNDPESLERMREYDKKRSKIRRKDPYFREKERVRQRERKRIWRDFITSQPELYNEYIEKYREYRREYDRRVSLAKLISDVTNLRGKK